MVKEIERQNTKPRKKFDKEYQTQYVAEVKYLREHGIDYCFVKKVNDIDVYKYKKTSELFKALMFFYAQNAN